MPCPSREQKPFIDHRVPQHHNATGASYQSARRIRSLRLFRKLDRRGSALVIGYSGAICCLVGLFRGRRFGFYYLRTHAVSDGQAKVFQLGIARTRSIRTIEIPSGQTAMYGCGKHSKTSRSLILNKGTDGPVAHESIVLLGNRPSNALSGAGFAVVAPIARGTKNRPDYAFGELHLIPAFRTETISGAVQTAA
jgi:hypothetical protein